MTPAMIDATEILAPAPRLGITRVRPADGLTVEIVALTGVLFLLLAILVAGGPKPGAKVRAEAPLAAAVAVPAAVAPAVVAAVPVVAAPAIVAGRTPNVIGMARDAAASALLSAGYRSISWMSESSQAPGSGTVLRQEPAAGSVVQSREARLVIAR